MNEVSAVPMIFEPIAQQLTWQKVQSPDGETGAQLLIQMPMMSLVVLLDRNSGPKLAYGLRDIFGGLAIVSELPPTNDQHR